MSHESAGAYRGAGTFATIIVLALGVCAPVAAPDLTLNAAVGMRRSTIISVRSVIS
jgi:hypothetical protein